MIVNCRGNRLLSVLFHVAMEVWHARIQAADDPLQLGEFLNGLGREIGLRQACCFVSHTWADCYPALANALSEPTAYPLSAPRFLVIRAEVFLESYLLQPGDAFAQ